MRQGSQLLNGRRTLEGTRSDKAERKQRDESAVLPTASTQEQKTRNAKDSSTQEREIQSREKEVKRSRQLASGEKWNQETAERVQDCPGWARQKHHRRPRRRRRSKSDSMAREIEHRAGERGWSLTRKKSKEYRLCTKRTCATTTITSQRLATAFTTAAT